MCNCSKFTEGCKQQCILDWLSIAVECIQIAMVKYITVLKKNKYGNENK